jgi:serine/threonine-protein kinase
VSFRDQLGVTFRAYPLDISAACRVGETRTEAPLELDLPRGSYLFVLRKAGRAEARLPVSVPLGAEVSETVELPEEGALPPGFLLVPAGLSPIGGDPEASQSLEYQVTRVGTFLMARCETTIGEYLEFLNDPETLARIEAASDGPGVGPGEARPLPECLAELPEGTRPPEDRAFVALVPALTRGLLFRRDEATGRWAIPPGSDLGPSTPVIGLSTLSALEYAAWRTRTSGGRWRYRLPTDIEWERAARGADRRIFVWGDYPIWSFTMSVKGRSSGPPLRATGTHPADESVFGIRDLAGSCSEPTLGKTTVRYRYTSLRGGSYYTTEDQYFRIANRNGRPPERAGSDTGIRLVAELRKPPKPNG